MEVEIMHFIRELKEKGFRLALDGEDLSFSYPKETASNAVAELRQKVKQNKDQLVAYLSRQLQTRRQRLFTAIADKEKKLASRRSCLASSYYAGDEWTIEHITRLEAQITEIKRCLSEGGELNLPRCCKDHSYTCLIAMRGFDYCIMIPQLCGFSLNIPDDC